MNIAAAFRDQARACTRLGSPFMGRLLSLLADNWPGQGKLAAFFATFEGDIGPAGHSLPLRLAGGLHALVLSRRAPALAAHYPPNQTPDADLRDAVLEALKEHETFLLDWTQSAPQTNEVRRSAALMAGARVAAAHHDLPFFLSELGASGGLNLSWDAYALQIGGARFGPANAALILSPDWKGPPPPNMPPRIGARAGVDLRPLDPRQPDDLLRLMAYLWPDQPERLTMTRAAASLSEGEVLQGDAIDWLSHRLAEAPEGHLHFIQHSVAWQYFSAPAQARGRALIEATGAGATANRPLAWMSMETDGDRDGRQGAALTLRLWPGDLRFDLGRADFHGRWIDWTFEG
ncbi:MAG: DUF2332 family protein [Sulfitobacter sp.]|nr:DUF2332 family protein [Sulfitobacter sp.]